MILSCSKNFRKFSEQSSLTDVNDVEQRINDEGENQCGYSAESMAEVKIDWIFQMKSNRNEYMIKRLPRCHPEFID